MFNVKLHAHINSNLVNLVSNLVDPVAILTAYAILCNNMAYAVWWLIMRSTGTVRKPDWLGRVVLPIELRRTLYLAEKNPLEVFVEGNMILHKRYEPNSIFLWDVRDVIAYKRKNVCKVCAQELKSNYSE